jgi:hypothetical protein
MDGEEPTHWTQTTTQDWRRRPRRRAATPPARTSHRLIYFAPGLGHATDTEERTGSPNHSDDAETEKKTRAA